MTGLGAELRRGMLEEFHQDHVDIAAHYADWRWDNARKDQWSSC